VGGLAEHLAVHPDGLCALHEPGRASRATLYYYFAGRDDLLAFLLTEQTRR
jgi:hypothetical protein